MFFILTVTRIRQAIIKAIPLDLKLAIVAGIGAFITIIGLKNAGIVVATPSTMIGLGNMMQPQAYLTILGVVLAGWMMAKGIRLALLITILIVAALGIVTRCDPDRRNSQSPLHRLQTPSDRNHLPGRFQ